MSSFSDIWQGFVIMVVFCIVGAVMALFGGLILDQVYLRMDIMGAFDVPPAWDSMDELNFGMNLYYGVCMLFPIVGIAAFIKTIIRKQGYDSYLGQ